MNKAILALTSNNIPKILNAEFKIYHLDKNFSSLSSEDFTFLNSCQTIVDLTDFDDGEKIKLLNQTASSSIYLDTTFNHGAHLINSYSHILGVHAFHFKTPTCVLESWTKDPNNTAFYKIFFNHFKLQTLEILNPGICFNTPRIVSMIINEAIWSLDDQLAEREDIDRAMKYGVNHPTAPFEYLELNSKQTIYKILQKLYRQTGDKRYELAPSLKKGH